MAATNVKVNVKMEKNAERKIRHSMRDPLQQAASSITQAAKASIKNRTISDPPAKPGSPPKTLNGKRGLKRAIMYAMTPTKEEAVIGPAFGGTALTGHYHEFGGVQARKRRIKELNSIYKVRRGKPGPVYRKATNDFIWRKVRTNKELYASRRALSRMYAINLVDGKKRTVNVYPQRPFMNPAFTAIMSRHYQNFKIRG